MIPHRPGGFANYGQALIIANASIITPKAFHKMAQGNTVGRKAIIRQPCKGDIRFCGITDLIIVLNDQEENLFRAFGALRRKNG